MSLSRTFCPLLQIHFLKVNSPLVKNFVDEVPALSQIPSKSQWEKSLTESEPCDTVTVNKWAENGLVSESLSIHLLWHSQLSTFSAVWEPLQTRAQEQTVPTVTSTSSDKSLWKLIWLFLCDITGLDHHQYNDKKYS